MFKRIAAGALVGWTGIVGLAWWLASERIALCKYSTETCEIRATAARDYVLTAGLTVALIGVLVAALGRAFIIARNGGRQVVIVSQPARSSGYRLGQMMRAAAFAMRTHYLRWRRLPDLVRILLISLLGILGTVAMMWLVEGNKAFRLKEENICETNSYAHLIPECQNAASPTLTPVEGDPFADVPPADDPQQINAWEDDPIAEE